ncbi:hypothetical protein SODALDRAFT_312787 [Sodiomyces alkalinus F11]|uniref:Zn(2)-C6 fungal-type domain-containing protein n=1 Tax=Sodiomyces alkalinus (strain CBS 110278 / VKM F-3762 / F11) TaxID=1314773 RepID=A0A3N2PUR4_SODAK|nr:hypothetical protein SODALDRAFT_312787 [Sodiomyces alkalinus F11]ROT38220.1 hypothetical protein SODALDRAFT_312787 [Sodiomyces alkalinus F11]
MAQSGSSGADGLEPMSRPHSLRTRASRAPRVRACAECRRHKIRCEVRRGELACARCLRTGLECVPHDPSQKLQEEDAAWKAQATAQIHQLQSAVKALLQRDHLPDLNNFPENVSASVSVSPADSALKNMSTTESVIAPIDARDDDSSDRQNDDDPGLVQAPMSNLYELTKASNPSHQASVLARQQTNPIEEDLIARGIVSLSEAEKLFARFMKNHNPLLWGGIILPHRTFHEVRRVSMLLSTAVMTIAALHTAGCADTLQRCYDAFVSLVSSSCLSRNHNLDDVRALCLGAFYLPNLSWRISGQAVRMAAEMNVHHSFQKLLGGDVRHAERVRLWYALYVCDRHFSIAYGRPSSMCDDAAVRGVERFIELNPALVPGDIRISAQVALFKILTDAHQEFGSDQTQPLTEQDLDKLRGFNIAIEQWRLFWQPRSADMTGIGTYPSKGVVLYYHFARFQLNSLALRGLQWPSSSGSSSSSSSDEKQQQNHHPEPPPAVWLNRREAAMAAISAATSTLVTIVAEEDIRRALTGVPLFTHAQVAFCATFLLKIAAIWARGGEDSLSQVLGLGFNLAEVLSLTRRSAEVLSEVSEQVSEKHLTRIVVAGIQEMMHRVKLPEAEGHDGVASGAGTASAAKSNGEHPALGRPPAGTDLRNTGAAADFAMEQMGDGAQDMMYSMDLDSLVGLLEYGSDQFLDTNDFGTGYWGPPV